MRSGQLNLSLIHIYGNSLRGIIKHLKNISDEDIIKLNLPTAVPYVFEFDENPVSYTHLDVYKRQSLMLSVEIRRPRHSSSTSPSSF